MCEANVYLKGKEDEEYELFLESVDKITPMDDGLVLQDIFGKRKEVKAQIKEMILLDHKILLERL